MTSRRDELNAYTFAKRRLVAQFLRPTRTGSDEGAPRPLRAVVPGTVVGVVILAGFGAWGMVRPAAPPDWDERGKNVLIADRSGTRYVVLHTAGVGEQLHPVLNMASARLLVDAADGGVLTVPEAVLDRSRLPRGATLGIPYAPDRLPDPATVDGRRVWAVCERPVGGGRAVQRAVFVLADGDRGRVAGRGRLAGSQLLYVQGPDGARYVVDARGTAYRVDRDARLHTFLAGPGAPQRVSRDWLATLHRGSPIRFPRLGAPLGAPAGVPTLGEDDRVGTVLVTDAGGRAQHYLVLPRRVAPVSEFTAKLLLNSPGRGALRRPVPVSAGAFVPGRPFTPERDWPQGAPRAVGAGSAQKARDTVCSVLRAVDPRTGRTTLATWAGTDFPVALPAGSGGTYVTPGSGQLFRQFQGTATGAGPVFLVTDTGLRHMVQDNNDLATDDAGIGAPAADAPAGSPATAPKALARLSYGDARPSPVPAVWSARLPTGPRLSEASARQPQGS
ncbi:type VII secretion protein EccB [Streptomyces sp. NPDC060194]|uniref:type VII secretion protein EccB n=1 Tax=Streptomyces sp. NPDC060194 TaxID=3347069 RepID=UPI00365A9642